MPPLKNSGSKYLTGGLIFISVAVILYFGYLAISDHSRKVQKNPFEYNIDEYKKIDQRLLHYTELAPIKINLNNLYGIAVSTDDQLYVSGDNSIQKLTVDGELQFSIEVPEAVHCLGTDQKGNLYLGMTDHIEVYNSRGDKISQWASLGEKSIVTSVAASEKFVFVADAGNRVVWKFNKSGVRLARIGEKNEDQDIPGFVIPSPYFDIAMDPDGFLWVVNPGRHSLENYTEKGNLRSSWGGYSMEISGFCGCCNPSHIAILPDGSYVTSEKGIVRVKVYNRVGNIVSVVAGPDNFTEGTVGLDLAIDTSQRIYVLDRVKKAVRIFKKKLKPESKG